VKRFGTAILCTPGHDEKMVAWALASSFDLVVLDLEDSVPAAQKAAAREIAMRAITSPHRGRDNRAILVRVNGRDSEECEADLDWARALPRIGGVVFPKAEHPDMLPNSIWLAQDVMPILETPAAFRHAHTFACYGTALFFGAADLCAALGLWDEHAETGPLALARAQTVLAAASYGIPAYDGPTTCPPLDIACARARREGFAGKVFLRLREIGCRELLRAPLNEVSRARSLLKRRESGGALVERDRETCRITGPPHEKLARKLAEES
jgi:citrate lyase beta subunit